MAANLLNVVHSIVHEVQSDDDILDFELGRDTLEIFFGPLGTSGKTLPYFGNVIPQSVGV